MSSIERRAAIGRKYPYAYIRKIVLQSNSNYSAENTSDPHVKKNKNKLNSDLVPKGEYITATLNMLLKDGAYANSHGQKLSWLHRDSYKKNTVITVVQFESKQVEKFFVKNIRKILHEKKAIEGATIKQIGLHEIYGLENKSLSYILKRTKNNNRNNKKITYSIPYRVKFISPSTPSYLSYIAFTHARDNYRKIGKIATSIAIEKGRTMDMCKALYTSEDNSLWAGATHTRDGNLFTGAEHRSISRLLKVVDLPNKKILDLRNLEKLTEPKKINFTSQEDRFLMNKNTSKKDKKNIKPSYFTDLFMTSNKDGANNLFFGIDMRKIIRDNSTFASLFDYPSKNNIHAINRMKKILLESKIISFSLQRRKIVKSSPWGLKNKKLKRHDRDVAETIVTSHDVKSTNSRILKTRTHRVDIPQQSQWMKVTRVCGSVREITNLSLTSNNNIGFRFFSISDISSKLLEQGEYQYTLQLNIQDGTARYMKRRMARLRASRRSLMKYYEEASKKGSYDSLYETFTRQFKIRQRQKYRPEKRPWINAVSEYVNLLEIFQSEGFNASKLAKKLVKICDLETGTPEGITKLAKLMDDLIIKIEKKVGTNISRNKTGRNVTSTTGNLTSFNGRTSVSKSIIEVTKEFDEIYKPGIESEAGYDYIDTANNNTSLAGAGIKTISYDEFNRRILEENRKYFSSDVIDGTKNNIDIRISTSDIKEEVVYTASDSIANTAYSFLSPSKIYLPGDGILKTTSGKTKIKENLKHTKQQYKNAILQITKMNLGSLPGSMQEANSLDPVLGEDTYFNDILSSIGCSVASGKQSVISAIDPNLIVSTTNNIVEEFIPVTTQIVPPSLAYNIAQGALNPNTKDSIRNYDLRDTNTALSKHLQELMREYEEMKEDINIGTPHPVKSLPNAIKSILLASSKNASASKINWLETSNINHPDENGYFYMNYKNIMRLEALVDLKTTSIPSKKVKKTSGINNMVWRTLTSNLLSTLAMSGTKALCRLVPYTNKIFRIKQEKNLALPIYNQYFLISFGKEKTSDVLDTSKAVIYKNLLEYEKTSAPPMEYVQSEIITHSSVRGSVFKTGGRSGFERSALIGAGSTPRSGGGGGMSGGGGGY